MDYQFKEIRKGEKHLEAYTFLDLYTTNDGDSFHLYKKAGMRVGEIREAQDRLPTSLYIKRDDAIKEVQMLQQEMNNELDRLMGQESPPVESTRVLIEDAIAVAADGLKDLSQLNEKDPEKTAEVLAGIKNITESVVSKCFDDKVFLENMLTVARKDFSTFQHSIQVAMYAMVFTSHQGFIRRELEPFVLAAMLHDIGVVFLPDKIVSVGRKIRIPYARLKETTYR